MAGGLTIMWQARENGLFYARFNLCGDWHCWLSLSGLLLPAKVGSFRALGPKRYFSANLAVLAQATVLSVNSTPLLSNSGDRRRSLGNELDARLFESATYCVKGQVPWFSRTPLKINDRS
jgi:hypothetical protein